MKIEVLNSPREIEEAKELVKKDNIFLAINTYYYVRELYTRSNKDISELDPADFWKLKSIKKMYKDSKIPEVFIVRIMHEPLIKIS